MHRFIILFVTSLFPISFAYCQDLETLKKQKVEVKMADDSSVQKLLSNIYTFVGSDFDSLDIEILGQGPILGALMVNLMNEDTEFTYGRLYDKFLEIKTMPFFKEVKNKQRLTNELIQRPADIANWDKDKSLFVAMGVDSLNLENIHHYLVVNSNPNITYKTLLEAYKTEQKEKELAKNAKNKNEFQQLLNSSKFFNESAILELSAKEKKPVLLYFTGHNCVNARKIEQFVLLETEVSTYIMENFIFIPLHVDDRTQLDLKDQTSVKNQGKTTKLTTVGAKNMHYEISRFHEESQPFFVVLNEKNEIINTGDYSLNNTNDFIQFLHAALELSK